MNPRYTVEQRKKLILLSIVISELLIPVNLTIAKKTRYRHNVFRDVQILITKKS
jgi:hypothetical protein